MSVYIKYRDGESFLYNIEGERLRSIENDHCIEDIFVPTKQDVAQEHTELPSHYRRLNVTDVTSWPPHLGAVCCKWYGCAYYTGRLHFRTAPPGWKRIMDYGRLKGYRSLGYGAPTLSLLQAWRQFFTARHTKSAKRLVCLPRKTSKQKKRLATHTKMPDFVGRVVRIGEEFQAEIPDFVGQVVEPYGHHGEFHEDKLIDF